MRGLRGERIPGPVSAVQPLQGAKVYLSAQMDNIGTSPVKVTFDTELWDVGGNFASNKYTIPSGQAGLYYVQNTLHMYGTVTDGTQMKAMIYVNGAQVHEETNVEGSANTGITVTCQAPLRLAVGDYVEFYAQSATANSDIYNPSTHSWGIVQQWERD